MRVVCGFIGGFIVDKMGSVVYGCGQLLIY